MELLRKGGNYQSAMKATSVTRRRFSLVRKHNMKLIVCCISLNIILVSGSSLSEQVNQKPSHTFGKLGQKVKIRCSHSIQNYNQILWYKHLKSGEVQVLGYMTGDTAFPETGQNVKIEGNANKDQNCTLTTEELTESSSAVYYCAVSAGSEPAYFGQGTKLTVLEENHDISPPKVEVLEPSPSECSQDKKKTLVCVASEFYPDHVTVYWQVNGINVTKGVATDNNAKRVEKFYTITSRLMVDEKEWHTVDTEFKCIVNFFNGKNNIDYPASVSGKKDDAMTRERYLRITQGAKLSYSVFIVKSCLYGAFVAFLVWKLQKSSGKLKN